MLRPSIIVFLISFSALLLEVLLIRWIAAEIHVFAYLKNLVLMACVLGLGLGCASASPQKEANIGFPILLLIVVVTTATAAQTGLTDISLLVDSDVYDFNAAVNSITKLLFNVAAVAIIFVFITAMFDMLGRELGKALSGMEPLVAYGSNLLGSLCGVIAFTGMSALQLGPTAWLIAALVPLIPVYLPDKKSLAAFVACTIGSVALAVYQSQGVLWSPYYRISTSPLREYLHENYLLKTTYDVGTAVDVNHGRHQRTINLSDAFLQQHPELKESNEFVTYNLPYQAVPNPKRVLVLGAGTGNDIAAALRHGAERVDAVEIDPVIAKLGKQIHPEHPYDDPRVHLYVNDARAYLASTDAAYDVIQFGHLDSQTAFSTASSVRLDNYLYTRESLTLAVKHLAPDGIACLSFATNPDWLRARLYQMMQQSSGAEPLAFDTRFDAPNSIMVMCGPGLPAARARLEEKFAKMVSKRDPLLASVEIPTDDWPFLYQRHRSLPAITIFMLAFVVGISSIMISSRFRIHGGMFMPNLHFFLLGAGFLLMETRAMLAVAILFGSTWMVNSIIIASVLLMALVANYLVQHTQSRSLKIPFICLMVSLVVQLCAPVGQMAGLPLSVKLILAIFIFGIAFLFSGIVFARAFAQAKDPQVALGINILGAVFGGCLEYLSVVIGVNGLVVLAMCVYAAAWWTAARVKPGLAAAPAATATGPAIEPPPEASPDAAPESEDGA